MGASELSCLVSVDNMLFVRVFSQSCDWFWLQFSLDFRSGRTSFVIASGSQVSSKFIGTWTGRLKPWTHASVFLAPAWCVHRFRSIAILSSGLTCRKLRRFIGARVPDVLPDV